MSDIETTTNDQNQMRTMDETYGYDKTEVEFSSITDLADCPHLGGVMKLK